jgi:hypothetical protein
VCPIGAIQNVTLALADPGYTAEGLRVPVFAITYAVFMRQEIRST